MSQSWRVPPHNPALSPAEGEAVMAHAAAQIAAEIRGLDAIGQVQLLVNVIGVPMVLGSWASDRIAQLERRLSELESKQSPAGARP